MVTQLVLCFSFRSVSSVDILLAANKFALNINGLIFFHFSVRNAMEEEVAAAVGAAEFALGGGTDGRNSPGEDEFRSKRR